MSITQNVVFNGNRHVSAPQKRVRRSQHARKETEFLRLKRTRLGLEDFESLKVIGRGAFGEVKTHKIIHEYLDQEFHLKYTDR